MAADARLLAALLLGAAWLPCAAQDPACATTSHVTPASDQTPGYGPASGPVRCEGFFEKTVSQPFLELVSLTRGPGLESGVSPRLDLQAAARLPLKLVVQSQRSGPFYRMDALLPAGGILHWDAAPMLAATALRGSDLGFLGVAAATGAVPAFAPVALHAQVATAAHVSAVVRTSVEVATVSWRIYRLDGDAGSRGQWTDIPASHRYAWQHVVIGLDMPADGKGLRLDVQATAADGVTTLPILLVSLVGPADATPD